MNNYIFNTFDQSFFPLNNSNNLSLIHQNIRSLRKNFDLFLVGLQQLERHVDIIILSETWIFNEESKHYEIPNYTSYFNCNENYRSGGIVIFVSNRLKVNLIECKMKSADVILLHIFLNKLSWSIFGAYRLHDFPVIEFITEIEPLFNQFKPNAIVMGDFNIDLKKTNSDSDHYLSLFYNHSFTSLISDSTRFTAEHSSCIDHIFVRHNNLSKLKSGIFHVNITDHSLIALIINNINIFKIHSEDSFITKRVNFERVKAYLTDINWDAVYNTTDVDVALDLFYVILNKSVTLNTTEQINTPKFIKAKFKSPWITHTLLNKLNKRNKLLKMLKSRPYDTNFFNYCNKFKSNLDFDINTAKQNYYYKLIEGTAGNSGEQWKVINSLIDKTDKKCVSRIRLEDGCLVDNPVTIANLFNDYFVSVSQQLITGPTSLEQSAALEHCHRHRNSIFLSPVTHLEISNVIKSLKNKKSTGIDNISVQLLKNIECSISKVLAHIVNLSFITGKFPVKLKNTIVVPIFKKGNREKVENHRPIALLSVISKIFERCMKSRLLLFLNKSNFFSKKQFGFTKGKSTESAITHFMEGILNGINNNLKGTGLFIDYSKAFDLVDFKILLNKLEYAGIRGNALDWFNSFLNGRTQQVKIGNCLGESKPIIKGVPQGSVLSATLFLVFVNDLMNAPFCGNITAFADDIALQYVEKYWTNIWDNINKDLRTLRSWCSYNRMLLNAEKTTFINFDLKAYSFDNSLKFHSLCCTVSNNCQCPIIKQVPSTKYLGVILDENISWKQHICLLHTTLRKSIRTFYFIRNLLPNNILRMLYFALIHSRLIYGIELWGSANKITLKPLEITQKHFVRTISFKPKQEPSFPLFRVLKILPLNYLFVYKVLKTFYIRSGNDTRQFQFYTRAASNSVFVRPKVNKIIFRKSFIFNGPKMFNLLPMHVRNVKNVKLFLNKLKCWLLEMDNIDHLINVLQ